MELKKHASGEYIFRNPKWTTQDTIYVEVEHDEFGWIPFNATPYDDVAYGRELFELLSTKYAEQVAPCLQSEKDKEKADEILSKRASLLRESDWVSLSDVQLENNEEWMAYRQALRDITAQPGYPWDVVFPITPASTTNTYKPA